MLCSLPNAGVVVVVFVTLLPNVTEFFGTPDKIKFVLFRLYRLSKGFSFTQMIKNFILCLRPFYNKF